MEDIGNDEADGECQRAHDFEVKDGLEADAAESLEVAHACDAEHDGEEDDRGYQHPDQLNEAVGEGLHRLAFVRRDEAEEDAGGDADEDAEVEGFVEGLFQVR